MDEETAGGGPEARARSRQHTALREEHHRGEGQEDTTAERGENTLHYLLANFSQTLGFTSQQLQVNKLLV